MHLVPNCPSLVMHVLYVNSYACVLQNSVLHSIAINGLDCVSEAPFYMLYYVPDVQERCSKNKFQCASSGQQRGAHSCPLLSGQGGSEPKATYRKMDDIHTLCACLLPHLHIFTGAGYCTSAAARPSPWFAPVTTHVLPSSRLSNILHERTGSNFSEAKIITIVHATGKREATCGH